MTDLVECIINDECKTDLIECTTDHIDFTTDLIDFTIDLIESTTDLIESTTDLIKQRCRRNFDRLHAIGLLVCLACDAECACM